MWKSEFQSKVFTLKSKGIVRRWGSGTQALQDAEKKFFACECKKAME
jgi:hypothetical protein